MKANEAPDKIYMQPSTIEQLSHQNIVYTKPLTASSIEYIRKDALLEWAKIKQTQCLENSTAHAYFQMFIDKINCI